MVEINAETNPWLYFQTAIRRIIRFHYSVVIVVSCFYICICSKLMYTGIMESDQCVNLYLREVVYRVFGKKVGILS